MGARVKAYAKLNLALAVTGAENGYHNIDSIVCTVDLYDLIKLVKRKDGAVNVRMCGMGLEALPPEKNNAYKAAQAYIKTFGTSGADISVYKNIPVGAGMGGSSADASGVLRGMSKLYGSGSERQLKEIADSLGSDTGYLMTGGFARLTGRGEKVRSLDVNGKLNFLMLLPEGGVSTSKCYSLYDGMPVKNLGADEAEKALLSGNLQGLGNALCNGLYAPAAKLNPDVEKAFEELKAFSPLGVNMTGSGSGVYALFENAEFCAWAKSRYRGKFQCIQLKTCVPRI
ncbi:MAG: 4-(cytidine 5'-diphospho)-2-C-methyl-D-erythritol kinase [Clostridia bacterium]|nr:4-(cytidine 5'-diphospho)-2-C-methyl-D-erythritol kinase [Clostridia bacterium]